MYCEIQDIRNEGVTEEQADDQRISAAIVLAMQYIDAVTGRFFEPREMELLLDGEGDNTLILGVPIISIDAIEIGSSEVDLDNFRIYNRLQPDDRNLPKIVFLGRRFPRGYQNVKINGVYGYCDEGEGGTRIPPALIKRACAKLVISDLLPEIGDAEAQEEIRSRMMVSETTDGHSYTLSSLAVTGAACGDAEVNRVLAMYRRPMGIALI